MKHGTIFRPLLMVLLICASLVPAALLAADVDVVDDEQCYPYCYEDTPVPPSGGGGGGSWNGFSDGRVAPDMAEYYTVYCANDQVVVWGGKPSPQLIQTIPLVRILQTDPNGGFFDAGAGLTVARPNEAIIIITGSNGNNAPAQGSKIFGLQECIDRNGGAPLVPAVAATPTQDIPQAEAPCDPATPERRCYDTLADFCFAVNFYNASCAPIDPRNQAQNAIVASVQFCLSAFAMVGFAPGLYLLRRRKHR